jgi:transposase
MDQKPQFLADDLRRTLSITAWYALYGVSRQTGYKWIERDLTSGPPGLEDRSRKPCSSPHQTPQHVIEALIEVRRQHPSWGAKKLLSILQKRHLEYPDRFEVRYVSANGGIRWHHQWVHVSHVDVGEYVGLEDIDDGVWNVYFGPLKLGRLLERHRRIEDAYGSLKRHQ